MKSGTCPNCDENYCLATSITAEFKPSPGDFAVCLCCGYVRVFDDDLALRSLTDQEKVEAAAHPELKGFSQ